MVDLEAKGGMQRRQRKQRALLGYGYFDCAGIHPLRYHAGNFCIPDRRFDVLQALLGRFKICGARTRD
jgi:hypothetical protein